MTCVHVLMPVFNRLDLTKRALSCLRAQCSVTLNIVVIDDGSQDNTADFLATQEDVTTLQGDGSLWWGGAIELGLRHVLPRAHDTDFVFFLNNDVEFDSQFVAALVAASNRNGRAAVGSIIRHVQPPHAVLSIGPMVDYWRLAVWDLLATDAGREALKREADIDVAMLSGRGTLYPIEAFCRAGSMRPRILPHYFADYEFADRVRRAGIRVVVASGVAIQSQPEWGNDTRRLNLWRRLFSKRSASNLLFTWVFWSLVGSPIQRCTALPRWMIFKLMHTIQKARLRS